MAKCNKPLNESMLTKICDEEGATVPHNDYAPCYIVRIKKIQWYNGLYTCVDKQYVGHNTLLRQI